MLSIDLLGFIPPKYKDKSDNEKRIEKIYYKTTVALLFINFLFFDIDMITTYRFAIWMFFSCVIQAYFNRKMLVDIREILLFVALLSYRIILHDSLKNLLIFVTIPLLSYEFAKLHLIASNNTLKRVEEMVLSIAIGMYINFFIGFCFADYSEGQVYMREWYTFLSKLYLPSTQHVIWCIPICATFFFLIKKTINGNRRYILLLIIVVYANIELYITNTRFLFLDTVLATFIGLVVSYLYKYKFSLKKIVRGFFSISIIIVTIVFISKIDIVHRMYDKSQLHYMMSRDGGILNNVRFRAQRDALLQIFEYPMGNNNLLAGCLRCPHNVWVCLAYETGIIPFVIMVIFSTICLIDIIRLFFLEKTEEDLIIVIVPLYVAINVYYMLEPALEASVMYWMIGTFINGLVTAILVSKNGKLC